MATKAETPDQGRNRPVDFSMLTLILALPAPLGGIGIDLLLGWPIGTVALWPTVLALGPVLGLLIVETMRQ
jgi:hypothetical protein